MGISSFGALLKKGDGASPENFTTIAEVQDISGPSLEADTEETTSHDSPGGWEESVVTILRGGEVGFDINWLPAHATQNASTGLIADMTARTKRNWKLVLPDTAVTTWSFAGFVTGFEPDIPVAGKLGAAVTIKITGQPTLV